MTIQTDDLKASLAIVADKSGDAVTYHDFECGGSDDEDSILASMIDEGRISACFPGESDWIEWDVDDFVRQSHDCRTLEPGNQTTLRTSRLAIQLVEAGSEMAEAVLYHSLPLEMTTPLKAVVRLNHKSLPVAATASKLDAVAEHYIGAVTSYTAVEVDFDSYEGERNETNELKIVDPTVANMFTVNRV